MITLNRFHKLVCERYAVAQELQLPRPLEQPRHHHRTVINGITPTEWTNPAPGKSTREFFIAP
jgi:hypothetical protein